MVASAARLDWQHSQDALRDEVGRVTALLRSIRDPSAVAAVGQWNLTEVALHLSQVWEEILRRARGDRSTLDEPIHVAGLGEATTRSVRADPERDLSVLADRIEACAKQYFADSARRSPDELRPWLIQGVSPCPCRRSPATCSMRRSYTAMTSLGRPGGPGGSTQPMRSW